MQPETLTPDMRIIGFFTDLRNVVQLVDDQVVASSYIIYIAKYFKINRLQVFSGFNDVDNDAAAARLARWWSCALACGFFPLHSFDYQ